MVLKAPKADSMRLRMWKQRMRLCDRLRVEKRERERERERENEIIGGLMSICGAAAVCRLLKCQLTVFSLYGRIGIQ